MKPFQPSPTRSLLSLPLRLAQWAMLLGLGSVVLPGCTPREAAASPALAADAPEGEVWLSEEQLRRANVTVGEVGLNPVETTVTANGKVAFEDTRVEHVFSPVAGRVTKILAELGSSVKKGQPLALIESPDIGTASADLRKAQADLTAAEHLFKRLERLQKLGGASVTDVEAAEDNYRKARAEVDRASARMNLMGNGGGTTQGFLLKAHIDGNVVMRSVTPGMEVQSQYAVGNAPELFTVGTTDSVWVLADVYEVDMRRVAVGAKARVTFVALPDRVLEGTIDYVGRVLDPVLRTMKVRVTLNNPEEELKPEMYATVTISVDPRQAPAVPRTAVLRLGGETVVFRQEGVRADGRLVFKRIPVRIDEGARGPTGAVEVKSGLAVGARIVTDGTQIMSSLL